MTAESSPHAEGAQLPAPVTISRGRQYFSLGILLFLSIFSFIDKSIISLMVGPIKADLGISDFQIGMLQGFAFAFFYAISGIPIGWALDRFPRRFIVYCGVTLWSLAAASCGLARDYSQMLVARFGVGVGEATLTPASHSMLSEIFPKRRLTTALAIFSLGASIGNGIAMLLGGFVVDWAQQGAFAGLFGTLPGWRVVFLLTGLPGIVLAFLIFLVPDTRKLAGAVAPTKTPVRAVVAFARQRRIFLTCHFLGFGCVTLMAYATVSWLPTYLIRIHDWTTSQAGAAMALSAVVSGAGVVLNGVIAEAMLRRGILDAHFRYYCWAAAVAGVAGVVAFQLASPVLTVVIGTVALALCAMSGAAAGALQLIVPPQIRGMASAMFLLVVGLLGSGAGPVVVAVITDFVVKDEARIGTSLSITYAIFAPISVILFIVGRKAMRQAMADQGENFMAAGTR